MIWQKWTASYSSSIFAVTSHKKCIYLLLSDLKLFAARQTVSVKDHSDQAKTEAKADIFFDVSRLLPPANVVCEGYVFTRVSFCPQGGHAWLLGGGACMVARGCMYGCSRREGVHGCSGGGCMVAWGGMYGCLGGMHGCCGGACVVFSGGACVVFWGVCMVFWGGMHRIRLDTVNERAVCILLECILVL